MLLHCQVLRYLGVSDGNMAEGSMRLDVNVSLRPKGETCLNTKVSTGFPLCWAPLCCCLLPRNDISGSFFVCHENTNTAEVMLG